MDSTTLIPAEDQPAATQLENRWGKALVFLAFFAALTSSPSLLRGLTPGVMSKGVPLLLVLALAMHGNFRLPGRFITIWTACFCAMLISGMQLFLTNEGVFAPINSAVILLILMLLLSNASNAVFREGVLRWWTRLFWVISFCSVANWILAPLVPSMFIEFDFGQLYEGNDRPYLISPFGAVIAQDYNDFVLYRVVGILAEPGMMSMFFLVNAIVGLTSPNKLFNRKFGLLNLVAAFATHSVAFYAAFAAVMGVLMLSRMGWRLRLFSLALICIAAPLMFGFALEFVQPLLMRSSVNVRQDDADFLWQQVSQNPLGIFFGYAWSGEYRQFPAAFTQLFYQLGLPGIVLYASVIVQFLKRNKLCLVAVLVYGCSIAYQDFLIFPLLLLIVKIKDETTPHGRVPGLGAAAPARGAV